MKTLVLYTFHRINENVLYFIQNGLFEHPDYHFIIIINNMDINISHLIPKYVTVINRENKGDDFGGWSYGLLLNNFYKKYDYFIFTNCSVMGPILPRYFKGKWPLIFINELNKNNIKLYGSLINCMDNPQTKAHVQSYIFALDKEGLEYLISKDIFSIIKYTKNHEETINDREVRMSREIINNGWNIGCLFRNYNNVDFTFKLKLPYEYNISFSPDNMSFTMKYYNEIISPYELIFIKDKFINNIPWLNSYIY